MARRKKTTENIEEEKVKLVTKTKVYDKYGNYVRTYDKETHGKDFKNLAVDYAKKISGKIR